MEENNFSILDRYGENFTEKEYVTNPAIGRDNEIKNLLLVLLTPEKSGILVGKPGVGKTAIVEGLAYRIINNDVPDALKGYSIINIKTASLLGTLPNGESKINLMIEELKQKDKVILFIDEIHMLIGATDTSSVDFANIFKEGLGRGGIKIVGATTTEEYERYILRDKAFTRRFQKIEVSEPTRDETIAIMMGSLPKIEKSTGAKLKYTNFIKENIMAFIVDLTSEYKRVFEIGSRYPDVSLTLLKQAFSYAIFDNVKEVNIFHIEKAIENSKNVYPDVIKKELPKFEEQFKEIINEEKGIKEEPEYIEPIEEEPVPDDEKPEEPVEEEVIENKNDFNVVNNDIEVNEYKPIPRRANFKDLDSILLGNKENVAPKLDNFEEPVIETIPVEKRPDEQINPDEVNLMDMLGVKEENKPIEPMKQKPVFDLNLDNYVEPNNDDFFE